METVFDVSNESDVGLMLLLGAAGDDPDEQVFAHEALRELHKRHYPYVLGVLEKYADNAGTIAIDPEEFALETFKKAFRYAGGFRDQSGGCFTTGTAKVRAWLGIIADNLARDELDRISNRKKYLRFVLLDESHDLPEPSEEIDVTIPTDPETLAAVQSVLDALKPAERDIVMTYGAFGIPTAIGGLELPKDVRDALEARTGYERCTIRQKWHRLKARLENTLPSPKNSVLHA